MSYVSEPEREVWPRQASASSVLRPASSMPDSLKISRVCGPDMPYPSICFVAQKAYGVLANKPSHYLGGVEVQIPLLARWFSKLGYDVSVVCWAEDYGEETVIDNIRVISMCKEDDGVPGLRFFSPRWTSLNAALSKASPDVVYYNYGDMALGQIVLWARPRSIPVVYSVPNDTVCRRDLSTLKEIRERLLYRYGLKHSDIIIAQTESQRRDLAADFGLDARVIPMPSTGFKPKERRSFPCQDSFEVLWVGRFTREKRLEWFLDLAERLPDVKFRVVGGPSVSTDYSRALQARARNIDNVTMHGRIAQSDMGDLYRNASLLCSTSTYEGFPNVFLEAWSTGLPVVATVDPDNVITHHGLGMVGTTVEDLACAIKKMMSPDTWQTSTDCAIRYFNDKHRVEGVMGHFRQAMDNAYDIKVEKTGVGMPRQLLKHYDMPTLIAETTRSKQETPRFSLVTATYQRAGELERLLASVILQIEKNPGRYEHVICDNGSEDQTSGVVAAHMKRHDDIAIRYYRQSRNYGLDKNIQDVLSLARGDYVWFVADDDDIVEGKLEYVADTCNQLGMPLVIVRVNNIADWEAVPKLEDVSTAIVIDPRDKRWAPAIYATSFLASMVFRRDEIERFQKHLGPVFGTNYTPWGLGLKIMSHATRLGYIDELCTLGNANFDGKNRFPPYRTLIKGRVQIWSSCAEGKVSESLKLHVAQLSASGWRTLAAGRLVVGNSSQIVLKEFFQMYELLGPRTLLSLPWVVIALVIPRRMRVYLDNLRQKLTK